MTKRLLILMLILTLAAAARPVIAAELDVKIEFLFDRSLQADRWATVVIKTRNPTGVRRTLKASTRLIGMDGETFTVEKALDAPPSSTKIHFLYLPVQDPLRSFIVKVTGDGETEASLGFTPLARADHTLPLVGLIGPMSRAAGLFVNTPLVDESSHVHEAVLIEPGCAPDLYLGYDQFFAVVLAPEALAKLNPARKQAIEEYVLQGGHVVILGGDETADWRQPLMRKILPVKTGGLRELTNASVLAEWTGFTEPIGSSAQYTSSRPVRGKTKFGYRGDPLVQHADYGLGTVTFLALNLGRGMLAGWAGNPSIWIKILYLKLPPYLQYTDRESVRDLLALREKKEGLPASVLAILFVVLFILVVGPVDWLVVRRTGKPWITWLILTASVAAFTGGGIHLSNRMLLSRFVMHNLQVIRSTQDGGIVVGETYHSLTAPDITDLAVEAPPGAVVEPFYPLDGCTLRWSGKKTTLIRHIGGRETIYIKTTWIKKDTEPLVKTDFFGPLVKFSYSNSDSTKVSGTITNNTGYGLKLPCLMTDEHVYDLYDNDESRKIAPGDKYTIPGESVKNEFIIFFTARDLDDYSGERGRNIRKRERDIRRTALLQNLIARRPEQTWGFIMQSTALFFRNHVMGSFHKGTRLFMVRSSMPPLVTPNIGQWDPSGRSHTVILIEVPYRD
jgi:hypothetical protein